MYLSKLSLWNFRKFGSNDELRIDKKLRSPDLEVSFTKNLNVLIGENDSGKTAIIDAIKLILKTHSFEWIRLEDEDFYKNTKNLRIECRFDDLSPEEAKNFIEWFGTEEEAGEEKVYLRVFLEAQKNDERIFPFDIKAGADGEGRSLTADSKEKLKIIYLRPLRDAKGEFVPRKNSRLSQILRGHEVFKGKNDTHKLVTDVFSKFRKKIEDYFENDKGKMIKMTLSDSLKHFFGEDKEFDFGVTKQKLKNILEALKLTLEDGNLGLGSHNLFFIASELLNLKRTKWDGIRLGLIEELEAHLHPQAQLRVIDSLQQEKEVQFILTTHSSNLASKVKLGNLIICADDLENKHNVFSMKTGSTKLDEEDYKFLEKFLDVTKANLFFAKGVILVEGWTEEILIPILAKKIGINLTEKGVSVVNVGGTAFLRYAKIFQRDSAPFMTIPVSVITDLDIIPVHIKKTEKIRTKAGKMVESKRTEKSFSKAVEMKRSKIDYGNLSTKVYFSKEWTMEYCLFRSKSLGQKFCEVFKEVHPQIDKDNIEEELVKKLMNNGLKKTEIAYRLAYNLKEDMGRGKQEISIDEDDEYIKYLIDAIKHVVKKT